MIRKATNALMYAHTAIPGSGQHRPMLLFQNYRNEPERTLLLEVLKYIKQSPLLRLAKPSVAKLRDNPHGPRHDHRIRGIEAVKFHYLLPKP